MIYEDAESPPLDPGRARKTDIHWRDECQKPNPTKRTRQPSAMRLEPGAWITRHGHRYFIKDEVLIYVQRTDTYCVGRLLVGTCADCEKAFELKASKGRIKKGRLSRRCSDCATPGQRALTPDERRKAKAKAARREAARRRELLQ